MRRRRTILIALAVVTLAAAGLGARWWLSSERRRIAWKNAAAEEVARQSADRASVDDKVAQIAKAVTAPGGQDAWLGESVAVMRDGQWIVFRSACVHEHQLLGDIFLGKASDGRWYYSSFHFCCDMLVPRIDGRPADLSEFRRRYALREFDGTSDDAIRPTWAPAHDGIH